MDKAGEEWINLHGQFIARLMRQVIPAFDKDELLGLCIMYNAGQLDFLFEKTRQQKAEKIAAEIEKMEQEETSKTQTDEATVPSTQE
jgi:hypothetical protein